MKIPDAIRAVRSYVDEVRRVDIGRVDDTRRDPDKVALLMASVARNIATYTTISTLASDTGGAEDHWTTTRCGIIWGRCNGS